MKQDDRPEDSVARTIGSTIERGRRPLAMVYGGGGVFGVAYTSGVAQGLADRGVPVRTTPSLGTSAGAWTAAALALGLSYDDFDGLRAPAVPTQRRGILADLARELFGEAGHELVSVSAMCVRSRRRHILHGGRYPLADLVAASSAVPGLLPPHRVDGRLYIDGGMWSATSLDAAGEAHHVVVVAPLAGAVMGPIGRAAGLLLERELERWRKRHPGSTVTTIRPNRAIAKVAGLHPLSLFDDARARDVYPMAHEQGLRIGEMLRVATAEAGTAA
jgi:predicted acylesterase/phospholipase RssA